MSTPNGKQWQWLYHYPKSSYKQLSVKGTKIHARTIYGAYASEEMPQTPEEVAEDFGVPLDAVLEAIEYVESYPQEIREDFEEEERSIEEWERSGDPTFWGPKRVAARLKELGLDEKRD